MYLPGLAPLFAAIPVSFEAPNRPAFTTFDRPRRFPIDELDVVRLRVPVVTEEEREQVPAGTLGTVVAVWGQMEAFELEFDLPVIGTAIVKAADVIGPESAA